MVSFGFAEGQGLESIRLKYYQTKHSDVARIACDADVDVLTLNE